MGAKVSSPRRQKLSNSRYCKVDFELAPECWMFVNHWDRSSCIDLVKKHTDLGRRKIPVLHALCDYFPEDNVQYAVIEHNHRQILIIENVMPRFRDHCIYYNIS